MIQIALYKGKSWWPSRMIEWFSWSVYSHASIVHTTSEGMMVYEAWGVGVQKHKGWGEHEADTPIDLFRFREALTAVEEADILFAAHRELGKAYDWRGVLSFVLRRRMQAKGAWFCSELVAHCCAEAGRLLLACPDWKIMPGDIAKSPLLTPDGHARE